MGYREKHAREGFQLLDDWRKHWKGMPAFKQEDLCFQSVEVMLRSAEDRDALAALMGREFGPTTAYEWFPSEERLSSLPEIVPIHRTNPRHPVYVISKGRWESRLTVKALEQMEVPYHVVIEPQELEQYSEVIDRNKIFVLPFSNLGKGSIPARNWVWKHSMSIGAEWHWIMDDNIAGFQRLYRGMKHYVLGGNVFQAAEDFVDRYENIGLAGFQYETFAHRKEYHPPYILNTRIYSCILIRNDLPHHWRGRYNEDTDLSLRVLKSGLCTVLFMAFLAKKRPTLSMKGGNTDELYQGEGRLEMAKSLQEQHPDCVTIVRKWDRWQHCVDYSRFKQNKLKLKPGVNLDELPEVDDHGMELENAR